MRSLLSSPLLLAGIALVCVGDVGAQAREARPGPRPLSVLAGLRGALLPEEARLVAPSLGGGSAWLNVDRALEVGDLRGRVVVIDFWTSCCINCLHTLPTLKALEERVPASELVVVGVHSPKFTSEARGDRLAPILAQYGVHHPIVVDSSMAIWDRWGARAWPSIAVLDARGRIAFVDAGEPELERLEAVVRVLREEARAAGILASTPLAGLAPVDSAWERPLSFPSNVVALADGGLAISDTAHHRVILTDRQGAVRAVVGSGLEGMTNGAFDAASFRRPRGLAVKGEEIYVADTDNHAVRAIDLRRGRVRTVAGSGLLGEAPLDGVWIPALRGLRSPWDLRFVGERLFVALAGSHQVGELDLAGSRMRAFAGTGREARVDGPSTSAAFAQPSALATDGQELFVLDSETSSVRGVRIDSGRVRTIVGEDLFVFGDVDGDARTTRLQHPLGLAYLDGALWVADTYNNKLKRIDPATGSTRTRLGGAGEPRLAEPAGLGVRDGRIVIVDTNQHRLIELDPTTSATRVWVPSGLVAPSRGVAFATSAAPRALETVSLGVVRVGDGEQRIQLRWALPQGTIVNAEAPYSLRWERQEGLAALPPSQEGRGEGIARELSVPITLAADAASLEGVLDLVVCDDVDHASCVPFTRRLALRVARVARSAAPARPSVAVPLPSARVPGIE